MNGAIYGASLQIVALGFSTLTAVIQNKDKIPLNYINSYPSLK